MLGFASPDSLHATESCSVPGDGWCLARRFAGTITNGELGFRFGEPLDVDGDGRADVAAGARWKLQKKTLQNGQAAVWSGADGKLIREWDGEWPDGMLGHWVMPIPDLSGDGLADLVIAAPQAPVDDETTGVLVARSPKTGEEIWKHSASASGLLGWDLTLAGDQDGDGRTDLFVGAPSTGTGVVNLIAGKDGAIMRTYAPAGGDNGTSFGWYVARVPDLDGDGHADFVAGGPWAKAVDGKSVGGAWVFSGASGKELAHWAGTDPRGGFGGVVAAAGDIDGDGKSEVAVSAPGTEDQTRSIPGELFIYSVPTGKELRRWSGTQPGELFGRMIVATADMDGDGVDDLAIGAPWHRRENADRVGRVEIRSARTGVVLHELIGDEADGWFGWHIRRAPDPEGLGRPTLLIGSLRHSVDGRPGVGVLDLYVLRRAKDEKHG
jgi:hypothetical protein